MNRYACLIALLLAAAASAASAASPVKDTNGDEKVDRRELVASGLFQRWDKNRDHRLSAEEFQASAYLFAEFDADADYLLAEDEFYRGLFSHLDADHDGGLQAAEVNVLERLLARPGQ